MTTVIESIVEEGLSTWKHAPDGKVLESNVTVSSRRPTTAHPSTSPRSPPP